MIVMKLFRLHIKICVFYNTQSLIELNVKVSLLPRQTNLQESRPHVVEKSLENHYWSMIVMKLFRFHVKICVFLQYTIFNRALCQGFPTS